MRPNGTSHRTWWLVGLFGLWVCAIAIGPAGADEADDIIKQILSKAKTRAEGARKLLDSAKMLNDAPAVQVRVCEKAYECGMLTPAGYDTALEALKVLDTVAPARAGAWGEKRLGVYRQQYLRADRTKKHVAWTGKHASLTVHSVWPLPAKTFALATYKSKVLWHSVRLRRLDATDRKLTCVSRGATYQPSSVHRYYKPKATFLTGRGRLTDDSFAVHTARQRDPYLVVALDRQEMVQRIIITNRRGSYAKYTTGLAVELSADGRKWTLLWRAPSVRESWLIDLKTPRPVRYVRISRPGTGSTYLILAGVQIYAAAR